MQKLSPFAYYAGGHPLQQGIQLGDAAVLLAAAIVVDGVGALVFSRRDLSV